MIKLFREKYMGMRVLVPVAALVLLLAGCSTTALLKDGEVLYNGMQLDVKPADNEKLSEEMMSDITTAVNVKPNNPWPLISPYRRMPIPYGLWVYNHVTASLPNHPC